LANEGLIAGLEATADFFAYLVQVYVQTNQGMLQMEAAKRQEKLRLQSLLTDDEGRVLQHLAEGKTNKEIAVAMGVSPRTVVNHLKQARQKLGVKTRTEVMVAAIRLFDTERK
jgi:DNA-binding CsgD family transcriptional regulator